MSFHIKTEQTGDVAFLQCTGRIVRGEALHLLKDAVTGLRRTRVIVLDLSGVRMIDCGGLGRLVFLHCWSRDNGIQLKVVNPSNFARQMLELTQLTSVLHVFSLEDASEVQSDALFRYRKNPSGNYRGELCVPGFVASASKQIEDI
jgi:anti-anti-sigma factor